MTSIALVACLGYCNRRFAVIKDRLKLLVTLRKHRKRTAQEKIGLVVVAIVLTLIAVLIVFLAPELRRALHLGGEAW